MTNTAPGRRWRAGADDFVVGPLDAEGLQLRLIAAARATVLQRQLADMQRTQGHLEGVTLAGRELAHRLNNDLALALGTLELVRARVPMPETFQTLVDEAVEPRSWPVATWPTYSRSSTWRPGIPPRGPPPSYRARSSSRWLASPAPTKPPPPRSAQQAEPCCLGVRVQEGGAEQW